MKRIKFLVASFFILTFSLIAFISCEDDDDEPYINYVPHDTLDYYDVTICRLWEVTQFEENGINMMSVLQNSPCYLKLRFKCDDQSKFYGIENTGNCYIDGSFSFNDACDSLSLNFLYGPAAGIGPWSSQQFAAWRLMEFDTSQIKLETHFDSSLYVVQLNPL